MADAAPGQPAGRTWVRNLGRPVRRFMATEVGSAAVLAAAAILALIWINSPVGDSYEQLWGTELSLTAGRAELTLSLREWVNDGLMAFFFFVIGLEIRRELDMGELRDRRRVAVPVIAAIGGMLVPALIFVSFTAGTDAVHGWGIVMATDTAFALALLGLVGRRWPVRLRVFMLSLVVVDDVGALTVIALVYTAGLSLPALAAAVGCFLAVVALRAAKVRQGVLYLGLGVAMWLSLLQAGVHPTIAGVSMGLLATAYPPSRTDLRQAAALWRSFREQPTSGYARTASRGLRRVISPNERMQDLYLPWTSYVIVPLFALANAGVAIDAELLRRAASSPLAIGIVAGLVAGKAIGISGASWLATRRRLGGFPLTIPWPPLIGAATVAGFGFTVSLFIAEISFDGTTLDEAKLGIIAASLLATGLGWLVFQVAGRLPERAGRARLVEPLVDLADPVDPTRDHLRGPVDAPVTLLEYGDYECPYCGRAEPVVRQLLAEFGADLRYVFRHLPLEEVHPHAPQAAEASEVAGAAGQFWPMHDLLFAHQDRLRTDDLVGYARQLRIDPDWFAGKLEQRRYALRVARDLDSADESGVAGTPTFFVNGRRHRGGADLASLAGQVRAALAAARPPPG